MQLEIERQRAAVETNNIVAQTEMFEKREADYVARKEKEVQAFLAQREAEKMSLNFIINIKYTWSKNLLMKKRKE